MVDDPNDPEAVLRDVPGGPEVLSWFRGVPSFHDGEVLTLHLERAGPSTLRVWTWRTDLGSGTHLGLHVSAYAIVTFILTGIVDLDLDGFSHQNVIDSLVLQRAIDRPERRPFYDVGHSPDDYEIILEPCYGLSGLLRANAVEVRVEPCAPPPPALALNA